MEIEPTREENTEAPEVTKPADDDGDEEEDIADLVDLLKLSEETTKSAADRIPILSSLLMEPQKRFGSKATSLKERDVYSLTRSYCETQQYPQVLVRHITVCQGFMARIHTLLVEDFCLWTVLFVLIH